MENDRWSTDQIVKEYKEDVHRLLKYVPWLQSKSGQSVSGFYEGEGIGHNSMSVPVYDSTLLGFVKEAKKSNLMERNYSYAYSRYQMKNSGDELRAISHARIQDMFLMKGIISRYILLGSTRASVWTEGVQNGVLLALLEKLKELIEFYEGPLD